MQTDIQVPRVTFGPDFVQALVDGVLERLDRVAEMGQCRRPMPDHTSCSSVATIVWSSDEVARGPVCDHHARELVTVWARREEA